MRLAATLAALATLGAASAADYIVVPLDATGLTAPEVGATLQQAEAIAVTDNGWVLGRSEWSGGASGEMQRLWRLNPATGVMSDLGAIAAPHHLSVQAGGINSSGVVIGTSEQRASGETISSRWVAVAQPPGSTVLFAITADEAEGHAVDDAHRLFGLVHVGGMPSPGDYSNARAVVRVGGVDTNLGQAWFPGDISGVFGVSPDGAFATGVMVPASGSINFARDVRAWVADVSTLPGTPTIITASAGFEGTEAAGVSPNGDTVGYMIDTNGTDGTESDDIIRGFFYDFSVSGIQPLALAGYTHSEAKAINDSGVVIGESFDDRQNGNRAAWVWTEAGDVMRELEPIISSGWQLWNVEGINNDGVIAASGSNGTDNGPVLLFPKPTVTLTMLQNGAEGGAPLMFRIARTGSTLFDLDVEWTLHPTSSSTLNGADAASASPGSLGSTTIPAGSPFVDVTVTIADDQAVEGTETLALIADAQDDGTVEGSYAAAPTPATMTIADNDVAGPAGVLAFSAASFTANENGGTMTVTVTRSGGTTGAAACTISTTSNLSTGEQYDTASAGSDFTAASTTLNWADGDATPQTLVITILNDGSQEGSEAFDVELAAPTGALLGAQNVATAIIRDDESRVSLSASAYTVGEGAGTLTVTLRREGGVADSSVALSTGPGGATQATAGSDYTAVVAQAVTWTGTDESDKTVLIAIADDAVAESSEQFAITIGSASNCTLGQSSALATITDNEAALAFQFSSFGAGEDDTVQLQVTRSGSTAGAASVNWTTVDGTAVSTGSSGASPVNDFDAAGGILNWAAGDGASKTITVTIQPDGTTMEDDETFTVLLSGATGATIVGPTSATVNITDNESEFGFASATSTVTEGGGGFSVTVERNGGNKFPASVSFTVNPASAAGDWTLNGSSPLMWSMWDGTRDKTIDFTFVNDGTGEPDETLTITLNSVSSTEGDAVVGLAGQTTHTVTIQDDDSVISFSTSDYDADEDAISGNASITVNRSISVGAASVTVRAAAGSAANGSDFTAGDYVANFANGEASKVVLIPVLDDASAEGDETVTLTLMNATAGYTFSGPNPATLTIHDDDTDLVFQSSSLSVAEGATAVDFVLQRVGNAQGSLAIDFAVAGGTATGGSDFVSTAPGSVSFSGINASANLTVTILEDALAEANEDIIVTLSNPQLTGAPANVGVVGTFPKTGTLTIDDDDVQLTFDAASTASIAEFGTGTILVNRLGALNHAVSIQISATGASSATAGDHSAVLPLTLSFPAMPGTGFGQQSASIPAVDDAIPETTEILVLQLGGATLPAGVTASVGGTHTLSITDNDGGFTFAASAYGVAENVGAGTVTITVNRNGGTATPESVDWATSNLTASAGSDYTAASGTLLFGIGQATATFSVTILDDAVAEADETFSVGLSAATGGLAMGSATTVTITNDDINAQPTLDLIGSPPPITEDAGLQNIALAGIGSGSVAEAAQVLTVTATSSDTAIIPHPAVSYSSPSTSGVVSYTPVANASGTVTITVTVQDDGGTVGGGQDTIQRTFTVTVDPVNDQPTFTKGGDETALEDSGAHTVNGWATAMSTGPASEAAQVLTFSVSNDNNALFSVQPDVDEATGTLTYTLAANAFGSATVTVQLGDNGGTLNGGVNTSTQTFAITVTGINDAPSFTAGSDQAVNEDAGLVTVAGWATAISAGNAAEAAQVLTFTVTGNTNPGLFTVAPAVDPATGDLTFTPATNVNGSATIGIRLGDNGGTANGGVAASSIHSLLITVNAVNDEPSFTPGGNQTVSEDAGAQSVAWASFLSKGAPDESAQTLSFDVLNTNSALFSVQPAISATGVLTYTPAANAHGVATVDVVLSDNGGTAGGGDDAFALQTFTITVTSVNDEPTLTAIADPAAILEDAGAQTVNLAGLSPSAAANEAVQTLTVTATSSDAAIIPDPTVTYAGGATGSLSYTPVANANGSVTITVTVQDNGGIANGGDDTITRTFTVAVTAVNDEPSFTKGADQSVLEDAGAQTVAGWATALSTGAANESAQTLSFAVTNDSNALFSAQPAISAAGQLTYTPAANAHGVATVSVVLSDNGGTAPGDDTAATQTFTITVGGVNDEPTLTAIADPAAILEDAGAQTVNLAGLSPSAAANEAAQTLTVTAVSSDTAIIPDPTVTYAGGGTGSLSYTPVANANGSVTITVTVQDNGGIANGGDDTITRTFTVAVTAVNDEPSFTKGADQSVLEDAAAQTVAGWATTLGKGPANESAQTLSFAVTNDNNALFSAQPAISAAGQLTYTLAANANGAATVSVVLSDDGGTANGGDATTATQTFAITVAAVNDAPSFTKGADQTVAEDAGAQTVAGWATAISRGPADEAGQSLAFTATNTNNALFTVQPAISPAGTLTFTPVADAFGVATVTVTLADDGGTANGGAGTSAAQTFTITLTGVNDVPSFTKGADQTVLEDAAAQTAAGWATAISAGNAAESAQTLAFLVSNTNNALFSVQPAVSPTGTLTWTPAANANGTATVSVSLQDDGGGTDTSAAQTFTITVTAVNDAPTLTAIADPAAILEDAAAQTVSLAGIGTGAANETQTLTVTATSSNTALIPGPTVTYTSPGASGSLGYTPVANANGTALITVTVTDNGGTANGGVTTTVRTFTVTVTAVNDAPVATSGSANVTKDTARSVTLTGTDVDGDTLTYALAASPLHGTISLAGNVATYTPDAGYTGPDSFTYTVSDGTATSAAGTITITVSEGGSPGGTQNFLTPGGGGGCGLGGGMALLALALAFARRPSRRHG